MLIRDADIMGYGRASLRIRDGVVAQIGRLESRYDEIVLEARGGALLPGLHDHHIHLAASAARAASVVCGPPHDAETLTGTLRRVPGSGWIRGIDYHESVLGGLPDAIMLDRLVADRPLRIQHRSGRMWLFNTLALEILLDSNPAPEALERDGTRFTGRLFDDDAWLQRTLGSVPPDLTAVSAELARCGVTGVTDMSPRNDPRMAAHFADQCRSGALLQGLVLAGTPQLAQAPADLWALGPVKLHLHEAALLDFDAAVTLARTAHRQDRALAVHCVTETELVYALAVLAEAGPRCGDRIEHVSVANDELLDRMAAMNLRACVQPAFVHERGDRYLADVEPRHLPDLYRLRALVDRGIVLAGGSDAPYGSVDPWAAMAAAVSRETSGGQAIGRHEALEPDEALALYLADPLDLSRRRVIALGSTADLCLLDRPWTQGRMRLTSAGVVATIVAGRIIYQRVDQSPGESLARTDTTA